MTGVRTLTLVTLLISISFFLGEAAADEPEFEFRFGWNEDGTGNLDVDSTLDLKVEVENLFTDPKDFQLDITNNDALLSSGLSAWWSYDGQTSLSSESTNLGSVDVGKNATVGNITVTIRTTEYALYGEYNVDLRCRDNDDSDPETTEQTIQLTVNVNEFATELVIQLLQNGSDTRLPFSPIVASGVNAANPHHFPTDKEFREGELVIVDWGATHEGYFSDITRTYAIGNQIDEKLLRAYEAVRLANLAGRSKAVVGVPAGEVDSATRKVIEDLGFGEFFTHRTGHGLGLEIHEEPYIKPDNDFVLQKGMTFTIEPGIYIPGLGGIRIEDDVYLKTSGLVSLTSLPRELIIV